MSWFAKLTGGGSSTKPTVPEANLEPAAPDELLDQALDALGSVLRSFGRHAFSLEETTAAEVSERFERWARHVLNNSPSPDEAEPTRTRAFRALQLEFAERRKAEGEHVRRVRDLIWDVMNAVRRALAQDGVAEARLQEPLDRLRKVVSSEATMSELRTEVSSAVTAIEAALADRRQGREGELGALGVRLAAAKGDLLGSVADGEVDPLTRVFMRAPFERHLENAASLADFTSEPLTLLVLDADRYKAVNEALGREAGDRGLRGLADASVRVASRSTDYVARLGSDEFAIVLGDTALTDAEKLAERLVEAARKVVVSGRGRSDRALSVSVGVAERGRFEPCAAWLERAVSAMKDAKSTGRDRVVLAQGP